MAVKLIICNGCSKTDNKTFWRLAAAINSRLTKTNSTNKLKIVHPVAKNTTNGPKLTMNQKASITALRAPKYSCIFRENPITASSKV